VPRKTKHLPIYKNAMARAILHQISIQLIPGEHPVSFFFLFIRSSASMRPLRPKPPTGSSGWSPGNDAPSGSSVNSDPISANTPSTPGNDHADIDELEALTRTITTLFNERDYTSPIILDHIAANFCFESDYVQACSTLAE
jgi:hypothetical protein